MPGKWAAAATQYTCSPSRSFETSSPTARAELGNPSSCDSAALAALAVLASLAALAALAALGLPSAPSIIISALVPSECSHRGFLAILVRLLLPVVTNSSTRASERKGLATSAFPHRNEKGAKCWGRGAPGQIWQSASQMSSSQERQRLRFEALQVQVLESDGDGALLGVGPEPPARHQRRSFDTIGDALLVSGGRASSSADQAALARCSSEAASSLLAADARCSGARPGWLG